MEITYDKKADAMYIYLQKGKKIAHMVELADLLIADLDKRGSVVGVEVLCASRQVKKSFMGKRSASFKFSSTSVPVAMVG